MVTTAAGSRNGAVTKILSTAALLQQQHTRFVFRFYWIGWTANKNKTKLVVMTCTEFLLDTYDSLTCFLSVLPGWKIRTKHCKKLQEIHFSLLNLGVKVVCVVGAEGDIVWETCKWWPSSSWGWGCRMGSGFAISRQNLRPSHQWTCKVDLLTVYNL